MTKVAMEMEIKKNKDWIQFCYRLGMRGHLVYLKFSKRSQNGIIKS